MSLFTSRRHVRWDYLLPSLHLGACLLSFIGRVIPGLQILGNTVHIHLVADLPISVPYYALVWKYGALAVTWIFLAGTLWCYGT
jgi:hypothetical protein